MVNGQVHCLTADSSPRNHRSRRIAEAWMRLCLLYLPQFRNREVSQLPTSLEKYRQRSYTKQGATGCCPRGVGVQRWADGGSESICVVISWQS